MLVLLAVLGCGALTVDGDEPLLSIRPAEPAPFRQDLGILPCGYEGAAWGVCIEASVRLESQIDGVIVPVEPLPYEAAYTSGLWVGAAIHDPWTVQAGEAIRAPYVLCLSCWDGDPAPPAGEYVTEVAWALLDADEVVATAQAEIVVRLVE